VIPEIKNDLKITGNEIRLNGTVKDYIQTKLLLDDG
jgi:hypothetical protein